MEGNLVELVNGGVLLAKEERTKGKKKWKGKEWEWFGRERGWGNNNERLANGIGEAMKKEIRDIMSKREKLVSKGKMVLTHEKRVSCAIFSKMG